MQLRLLPTLSIVVGALTCISPSVGQTECHNNQTFDPAAFAGDFDFCTLTSLSVTPASVATPDPPAPTQHDDSKESAGNWKVTLSGGEANKLNGHSSIGGTHVLLAKFTIERQAGNPILLRIKYWLKTVIKTRYEGTHPPQTRRQPTAIDITGVVYASLWTSASGIQYFSYPSPPFISGGPQYVPSTLSPPYLKCRIDTASIVLPSRDGRKFFSGDPAPPSGVIGARIYINDPFNTWLEVYGSPQRY